MSILLNNIKTSLEELELGLKGDLNMTDAMEKLAESLTINRVPANWGQYYFNKRPLASWFSDLKERYAQLERWTAEFVLPQSTCLSYFFNPMSFLTAIMQVTAKERNEALDSMVLCTTVTKFLKPEDIKLDAADEEEEQDDEGSQKEEVSYKGSIFIHGLFLEGASWETGARVGYLTEMRPKELHPPLPVIAVSAILMSDKSMNS